jgi:FMN reductase
MLLKGHSALTAEPVAGGSGDGRRPVVVGIGGSLRPSSTTLAALARALDGAADVGAATELIDLRRLALPMYDPCRSLEDHGDSAIRLVAAARAADGLLLAIPAYQGTVAGVSKNALDFLQFLADENPPYLDGKVVGLIATADGTQAAPNAVAALVHVAHALRAVVAPMTIAIPHASANVDGEHVADPWDRRLGALGRQVVALSHALRVAAAPVGARR